MNANRFFILFLLAVLFLLPGAGCGKSHLKIGKGEPDAEFKECLRLSAKGKYEDTIQCMEMYKARYPNTIEGQEAELRIGDAQFAKKEYLVAAESYQAFVKLSPTHPKVDYAYLRSGISYLKESPKAIDRDQQYLSNAIEQFRTLLRRYPTSSYADLAQANLQVALKRIAKRHFYVGRFYYRTGQYIASLPRFKEVFDNYPESGLVQRALYLTVVGALKVGKADEAREAYSLLQVKYPGTSATKSAEKKMLKTAKAKG